MAHTSSPYLALRGLTKRYGDQPVVRDLNLDVYKGELVSLLGASGCGKTTTLRMVAGLIEPSAGQILLDGGDLTTVAPYRRNIGVVFQSYALFPHLSVAENVAFGLRMRGISRRAAQGEVVRALALVRLEGLGERKPRELSGGQQQRVALARALIVEPRLLLLDEPLSNLDAKLREVMRDEIRRIQQTLGITAVFVTHDQIEALTISDRIAVMRAGEVAQLGTPAEIYTMPRSPFVARFVGRINSFITRPERRPNGLVLVTPDGVAFSAPRAHETVGTVEVMIRPHHIALEHADLSSGGQPNTAVGRVAKRLYTGDITQVHVQVGSTVVIAELPAGLTKLEPEVNAIVRLSWRDEHVHYFPA
jgi:putative spermidine/putrescine transport system ATP-binding protein